MQITGELVEDKIFVKKPRDIGRLFDKSEFGKTTTGNVLQLDLLEGCFLLDEKKIKIFYKKTELKFQDIIKIASEKISRFEIKYLVFKELRKRGHHVKLGSSYDFDFFIRNQKKDGKLCFISIFSERDLVDIRDVKKLINKSCEEDSDLWFVIVDEEGDLTFYDVSPVYINGEIQERDYPKSTGFIVGDRVVVFDGKLVEKLSNDEFFGKPFGNGLQLSLIESLYLFDKDIIDIKKLDDNKILSKKQFVDFIKNLQPDIDIKSIVFNDLKKRGLIVKTGFKFGSHFRVYTKSPDESHAEYLVHVIVSNFRSSWAEISRAVRLAHSVNKDFVFARVDEKNIDYIKLGRLKP